MSEKKEGLEILKFLYKQRKWLALSTLVAGLASIVITSFMTPKFEAIATVFPPGFNSADKMLENPQFGYNIEADRLIQIGESLNLKDSLIETFDLVKYYGIDDEILGWKSILLKQYEGDISLERTKYMSVQVVVKNKDPEKAAEIANEIVALLSRFWERLFKNNMLGSLNYAQKMYVEKQREVSVILSGIHELRMKNSDESLEKMHTQLEKTEKEVEANLTELALLRESSDFYDYSSQLEIISEEVLQVNRIIEMEQGKMHALEKISGTSDTAYIMSNGKYTGAMAHKKYLENQLKVLKKSGKRYDQLTEDLEQSMAQFHNVKSEYENLLYSFEPLVESVDLHDLESQYLSERIVLSELKKKFEVAHRYYNEPLPSLFIIDDARPIYKKSSPSYRINLILSCLAAFLFTIFFLLIKQSLSEIHKSVSS